MSNKPTKLKNQTAISFVVIYAFGDPFTGFNFAHDLNPTKDQKELFRKGIINFYSSMMPKTPIEVFFSDEVSGKTLIQELQKKSK